MPSPDSSISSNQPAPPGNEAVREQLDRIKRNGEFETSKRSADFLEYVVERVLEGRECEISQHAIAGSVFMRGPDFDPTADPIVRIQAGRVRRSLKHYYSTEGTTDPVVIELPKGTYIPAFRWMDNGWDGSAPGQVEGSTEAPAGRMEWPCILVTPFRNLTGEERNNYLSDGMAADLATELSNYSELCVFLASPGESERRSPEAVKFELCGSIHKSGQSLRLSIQLLANPSRQLVWAHNYRFEENLEEGSAPLDDLTQEIAALIAEEKGMVAQHMVNESRRTNPTGSAAYQALLEYYHLDLNFDPARFMAVMETLEKIVEKDPDNGACWTSLARLYADMLGHEMMQDRVTMEQALTCARNGVERLPYALKGHLILALLLVLDDQMNEALRHVEIACELNRGALSYLDAIGYLLVLCGDWERGPIFARRAVTRNPFHRPIGQAGLWLDAVHRADWPEALERARLFNLKYSFWGPLMRIVAMVSLGMRDGTDSEARQLLAMKPDFPQSARHLVGLYIKGEPEQDRIAKALQAVDLLV